MKPKIDMPANIVIFKDVCNKLYLSSRLLEHNKAGKIIYEDGYGEVINMVLTVPKYSRLVADGCTLAEVGYILGLTRERIRQYEDNVTGSSGRAGKLMSLKDLGAFSTKREKLNAMNELKEEARKT